MLTGRSHDAVVTSLVLACRSGATTAVGALLAPHVVVVLDGDGEISGQEAAGRILLEIVAIQTDCSMTVESVNGCAGLVYRQGGVVTGVVSFGIEDGQIFHVWAVVATDKLQHWNKPKSADKKVAFDHGS